MRNRMSTLLGIGLVILWIAGLGSSNSRGWLTWLDGVAALLAFSLSAVIPGARARQALGGPVLLAAGLFALWIIGIVTPGPVWQAWWSFVFGILFLGVGFSAFSEKVSAIPGRTPDKTQDEREKMRKSA